MKKRSLSCPICNANNVITAKHMNGAISCLRCGYVMRKEGYDINSCVTELNGLEERKALFNKIHACPINDSTFNNPRSFGLNMELNGLVVNYLRKLEAIRKLEEGYKGDNNGNIPD